MRKLKASVALLVPILALLASRGARSAAFEPREGFLTALPGQHLHLPGGMQASWRASGGRIEAGTWVAPREPGTYALEEVGATEKLSVLHHLTAFVTLPASLARGGVVAGYRVGYYPELHGRHMAGARPLPSGLIEVTDTNREVPISPHFTLGDFACKDGEHHQVMFLQPSLLRKLELLIAELNAEGHPTSRLHIMSGYRTPAVNTEIGNKTTLSRHTYGDAADVLAEDWDGTGQVTHHDGEILYAAVNRLDDRHPELIGGASLYPPTSGHTWFVHTDARGYRVRW